MSGSATASGMSFIASERVMSACGRRSASFWRTTLSDSGSFATKMSQPPSLKAENTTRSLSRDHDIENTPPMMSVSWRIFSSDGSYRYTFCAPPRSETNASDCPSGAHAG